MNSGEVGLDLKLIIKCKYPDLKKINKCIYQRIIKNTIKILLAKLSLKKCNRKIILKSFVRSRKMHNPCNNFNQIKCISLPVTKMSRLSSPGILALLLLLFLFDQHIMFDHQVQTFSTCSSDYVYVSGVRTIPNHAIHDPWFKIDL